MHVGSRALLGFLSLVAILPLACAAPVSDGLDKELAEECTNARVAMDLRPRTYGVTWPTESVVRHVLELSQLPLEAEPFNVSLEVVNAHQPGAPTACSTAEGGSYSPRVCVALADFLPESYDCQHLGTEELVVREQSHGDLGGTVDVYRQSQPWESWRLYFDGTGRVVARQAGDNIAYHGDADEPRVDLPCLHAIPMSSQDLRTRYPETGWASTTLGDCHANTLPDRPEEPDHWISPLSGICQLYREQHPTADSEAQLRFIVEDWVIVDAGGLSLPYSYGGARVQTEVAGRTQRWELREVRSAPNMMEWMVVGVAEEGAVRLECTPAPETWAEAS